MLQELINDRNDILDKLSNILCDYIYKYIKKYRTDKDKLYEISNWDKQKRLDEYSRFIRWCSKKDRIDINIQELLNKYISIVIEIMLNKHISVIQSNSFKMSELFYKCFRRVAKSYYETKLDRGQVLSITTNTITNTFTLKQVRELLELYTQDSDTDYSYTFSEEPEEPEEPEYKTKYTIQSNPSEQNTQIKEHKLKLKLIDNININNIDNIDNIVNTNSKNTQINEDVESTDSKNIIKIIIK